MFSEMGSMEQSQGFLPSIPNRISQNFPNFGKSLKLIKKQTKPPSDEGMTTCPRLQAGQEETGRSQD